MTHGNNGFSSHMIKLLCGNSVFLKPNRSICTLNVLDYSWTATSLEDLGWEIQKFYILLTRWIWSYASKVSGKARKSVEINLLGPSNFNRGLSWALMFWQGGGDPGSASVRTIGGSKWATRDTCPPFGPISFHSFWEKVSLIIGWRPTFERWRSPSPVWKIVDSPVHTTTLAYVWLTNIQTACVKYALLGWPERTFHKISNTPFIKSSRCSYSKTHIIHKNQPCCLQGFF